MQPALTSHVAWCFEGICRQHIEDNAVELGVTRVGRHWDRHCELDVAGVDAAGQLVLAGECKMTHRPIGLLVLSELREKVLKLRTHTDENPRLAIFSTGGFTSRLKEEAASEGVLLIGASELGRERVAGK